MKRCHIRCMLAQAFLRFAACGSLRLMLRDGLQGSSDSDIAHPVSATQCQLRECQRHPVTSEGN